MDDQTKILLEAMFQRYGRPSEDAEISLRGYFTKPEGMLEPQRIARADQDAAQLIARCEETIRQLAAYRLALTEQYGRLATAPTQPVVRLKRQRGDRITYRLETLRRFVESGLEVREGEARVYPGTERHRAIADFRA